MNMHALYEPPPVKFHFETPGWYMLGALLILGVIFILIRGTARYIRNKYRRDALRELNALETASAIFPGVFVILKRTAMHAFGRQQVGPLYGKEWLHFLESTGKEINLTAYQEQIADAVYAGKSIEGEVRNSILSNAKKWVKTHAS